MHLLCCVMPCKLFRWKMESKNHASWKSYLGSSPAVSPLPSPPLSHVFKCHIWNPFKHPSITSPGTQFQGNFWRPFWRRNFFLTSTLNLPWCNLRPFPLVLLVFTQEKETDSLLITASSQVVVHSNTAMYSNVHFPPSLLFSRLNSISSHRICASDIFPALIFLCILSTCEAFPRGGRLWFQ